MKGKEAVIGFLIGVFSAAWLGLLAAPYVKGGLVNVVMELPGAMVSPFNISVCEDSLKVVLIFLMAYVMGIGVYFSTKRNYRRGEEMGSAKWGDAIAINKKYRAKKDDANKILTQNVKIGLDGRKHRRNLNVLVCGGSGAGKTRFYCKPNIMQANSSLVILDPNGKIVLL